MEYQSIKDIAEKDRIAFKKHCTLRMYERKIFADEVKEALTKGKIVENYPEDRPLHVVVAIDVKEQMLWIIAAYEPGFEEWEQGFKRRISQ